MQTAAIAPSRPINTAYRSEMRMSFFRSLSFCAAVSAASTLCARKYCYCSATCMSPSFAKYRFVKGRLAMPSTTGRARQTMVTATSVPGGTLAI